MVQYKEDEETEPRETCKNHFRVFPLQFHIRYKMTFVFNSGQNPVIVKPTLSLIPNKGMY